MCQLLRWAGVALASQWSQGMVWKGMEIKRPSFKVTTRRSFWKETAVFPPKTDYGKQKNRNYSGLSLMNWF